VRILGPKVRNMATTSALVLRGDAWLESCGGEKDRRDMGFTWQVLDRSGGGIPVVGLANSARDPTKLNLVPLSLKVCAMLLTFALTPHVPVLNRITYFRTHSHSHLYIHSLALTIDRKHLQHQTASVITPYRRQC